ncbi:MAG: ABC transporter permease [Deltaproteobacteria bacterium]|nr:ABC transporter permease [Deltaproteobacteria bacterium]
MRNIATISKRELASYFNSPMAYIVMCAFLLVSGWMFFSQLFLNERADMRLFFSPSPFSPSLLLVIFIPAISMRLIAEERKNKTIELLTTMPVKDSEVIVGKFLGALFLVLAALAATLIYAITVWILGPLDWGPVLCGYLGMALFAGAILSIGIFASTLTDNQIVAFIIGLIICGALYYIYWLQFLLPGLLAPIVEYISISSHLANLARGVIDTRDILYYLTVAVMGLFLASLSLSRQHA